MKLTQKHSNNYSKNGYIIIPQAISKEDIISLQKAILAMVKKYFPSENDKPLSELLFMLEEKDHSLVYNIHKTMSTSAIANKIISNFDLNIIHSQLYNIPVENIHAHLFQTPCQFPGSKNFDFSWHQESGSFGKDYSKILTCWFPILGKVNSERGSTEIIPKTHLQGIRETKHIIYDSGLNDWVVTPAKEELESAVVVELEVGDVLLFDSNLIHRSVSNISNTVRITGIARTIDICALNEIKVMAEPVNYLSHN